MYTLQVDPVDKKKISIGPARNISNSEGLCALPPTQDPQDVVNGQSAYTAPLFFSKKG